MPIPISPQISLSPTSFDSVGDQITATVSVLNRPAYHGKPKITGLTTITPKIVISRPPTGVIPFHVMVSACETTCNAGSAYRDLHYEWDFGDSSGTETFTDQWNGQTVNANDAQTGPEAAYLYRTAGTFTITLTVKGKDENGNLITASTTTISAIGTYFPWLGAATGGTYTLTVNGQTTSAIAFDASRTTKQTAMESLSNLDSSNVLCRQCGSIEFIGSLAGDDSISLTGDFSGLTGTTGTPAIRTEVAPDTFASVSVSDMSGLTARYVDSTYGGENGASDGTISRPYTTWAHIVSFITGGSNRVCYVKRGSSFAATTQAAWDGGERVSRIVAYGSGANPIFTFSSSGQFYFEQAWGTAGVPNSLPGDFVFSGLSFVQDLATRIFYTFGSSNGTTSYPYARLDSVIVDSCDYTANNAGEAQLGSLQASSSSRGQALVGVHLWNVTIDAGTSEGSNWYVSPDQWASMVGGSITGGDGDLTFDHHLYVSTEGHNLYRWISFGAGSKSYCINGNCHVNSQPFRYYLVDGCDLTGTKNGLDFSNTNNDPAGCYFDDVVVQFCHLHSGGVSPTEQNGIFCYNLKNITIRYCDFWDNNQSHITSAVSDNPTLAAIYGCRFWDGTISVKADQVWYFHDNVMSTTTTNRRCISFASGATNVELWDCDGNVYWAENATEPFYNSTGADYITLATWQGYGNDAAGSEANPNWSDPGNGTFLDGITVAVNWPAGFTSMEYSTNGGGAWSAYTDEANIAIADTSLRAEVLFRANPPAQNGTFNVVATSDAASGDTASETDSDSLIGTAGGFMARSFVAGSSQYGDTASTPVSAYPFSMSAWVKCNAPAATQEAFGIFSSASNNPLAAIRVRGDLTDDIVEWFVRNNGGTTGSPLSSGPSGGAGGNVWTLVTCVATSVTSRSIFINGANKVTNTTDLTGAWSPTKLGCAASTRTTVTSHATIELAELAMWNIALSDAEVASLYVGVEQGLRPSQVAVANLVGYWPDVGVDSVGSADFTLYNSPAESTPPTMTGGEGGEGGSAANLLLMGVG